MREFGRWGETEILILVSVTVVSVFVGGLAASRPDIAISLGLIPLFLLLLASPLARLVVTSYGALLTFQSTSEVSSLKSVYLVCFVVALTGACLSLGRDGLAAPGDPIRKVAAAGGVVLSLVAVSFVPALLYGTPLVSWVRDGFSYFLFGGSLLLAIDFARHVSRRTLTLVLVSCGGLATVSFFLSWIDRRGIGELEVTGLGFSSFFLAAGLISFAVARTPWLGARRFGWSIVGALAILALLATATRSSLVILVAVIVVLMAAPTSFGTRVIGIGALVAVTLGIALVALKGGIASDLIDVQRTTARLSTVTSAITDPGSDETLAERRGQTRSAMEAFETAPILGIGPGHQIKGTVFSDTAGGYFVDSPAGFLAKFGLVGIVVLIVFLWLIGSFLATVNARATPAGLALIAFLTTILAWSFLGTVFDDKGTGLALGLLVALTIQETEALARQPTQQASMIPRPT